MPNVTTKVTTVSLEPQLLEQLKERAAAENRSVSKHVVHLVKEDLKSAGIALKPLDPSLKNLLKREGGKKTVVTSRPDTHYVTGERVRPRRKTLKPSDH